MPRVSEEHLEARRRQILDAARRCFADNGFHSTSMQNILGEAGLSAGAVYRYFPAKEDIIAAIAQEAMESIRDAMEADHDAETIGDIVDLALHAVDQRAEQDQLGRLALQVWAEAARSERLRERLADTIREVRVAIADRIQAAYGPDVEAHAAATAVSALLPGYVHAKVIAGDMDVAAFRHSFDALVEVMTRP